MIKRHCSFKLTTLLLLSYSFLLIAESKKDAEGFHDLPAKEMREIDWRARPIFLLKVRPGVATKEQVTEDKLLPERLYARSEPRIYVVDEKTGEKKITGGWGVDFTNDKKKFLDEPRRLLRVGAVVPGSLLGDTDERNYEFTRGEGTFAERFKVTKKPVSYIVLNFYANGKCTEEMFGPHERGVW